MRSVTAWDGQSDIGERHSYIAILVAAMAAVAASIFAPAYATAQGAFAQKRISAVAADSQSARSAGASPADRHAAASRALKDAPLGFIANHGQADARAAFYARRGDATFWLTREGVVFDLLRRTHPAAAGVRKVSADGGELAEAARGRLDRAVVSERFLGANPAVKLDPQMVLPTSYGYIHGSDPSRWLGGLKSYRLITYRGLWSGVDLRVYGMGRDLEQEFVIAPRANPGVIRMRFDGARGLHVAGDGTLVIETAAGPMRELAPFAYQHVGGQRVAVAAHFTTLDGENRVGFALASYRHDLPLVIDPPVLYATYLGGIHDDQGQSIAVDAAGNSYVTGFTASEDFPVSATAFQTKRMHIGAYVYNAFVTKLSPAGVILYSTFVGGSGDQGGICGAGFPGDCGQRIAVDAAGNAYVTGGTSSSDFPITAATAFQPAFGGGDADAFLFKLSPDGSHLVYSTFLGANANEGGLGIATDGSGHVWIGGEVHGTGTFPTTLGAFQRKIKGADNGFVAAFDLTKAGPASLMWSTLLGGTSTANYGGVLGLTVDTAGHVFVTGQTHSADFPTTATALTKTFTFSGGCLGNGNPPFSAAFVSKLSSDGTKLLYSTFVGGTTVAGISATSSLPPSSSTAAATSGRSERPPRLLFRLPQMLTVRPTSAVKQTSIFTRSAPTGACCSTAPTLAAAATIFRLSEWRWIRWGISTSAASVLRARTTRLRTPSRLSAAAMTRCSARSCPASAAPRWCFRLFSAAAPTTSAWVWRSIAAATSI